MRRSFAALTFCLALLCVGDVIAYLRYLVRPHTVPFSKLTNRFRTGTIELVEHAVRDEKTEPQ
jgi:hypothetical protein